MLKGKLGHLILSGDPGPMGPPGRHGQRGPKGEKGEKGKNICHPQENRVCLSGEACQASSGTPEKLTRPHFFVCFDSFVFFFFPHMNFSNNALSDFLVPR